MHPALLHLAAAVQTLLPWRGIVSRGRGVLGANVPNFLRLPPIPKTFTVPPNPLNLPTMLRRCTMLASLPRSLVRPRPVLFSPLAPSLPPPSLAVCTPLNPNPLLGVRFGSRKAGSIGVKTKSAVKKRFRVNGGGTLKRMCSGKRHLNIHKSSAQIHRLGAWCGEEEEPFLGEQTFQLVLLPGCCLFCLSGVGP